VDIAALLSRDCHPTVIVRCYLSASRNNAEADVTDRHETTLEELLSDPVILKVMARDGVRSDDIRYLVHQARSRMGEPMHPVSLAGTVVHVQAGAPGQA
jgi:hypothetical protein